MYHFWWDEIVSHLHKWDPWLNTSFIDLGRHRERWWETHLWGILKDLVSSWLIRHFFWTTLRIIEFVPCFGHLFQSIEFPLFLALYFPDLNLPDVTLPKPPRPITLILLYFFRLRASGIGAASFVLTSLVVIALLLLCSPPISFELTLLYIMIEELFKSRSPR